MEIKRGIRYFFLLLIPIMLASYGCTVNPACNDGLDNDGDGFTDFPNDVDCDNESDTTEDTTGCCELFSSSGQISCLNNYKESSCNSFNDATFHSGQSCQSVECGVLEATTTTLPSSGPVTCVDSDGQDYETKGTTTMDGDFNVETVYLLQASTSVTDVCDSEGNLVEYYCSNNKIDTMIIDCESEFSIDHICSDGVCELESIP